MSVIQRRVFACAVLVVFAMAAASAATVCDVHSFGAKGDGKTKDTAAIQAAIDHCASQGGGRVVLAKAKSFVSGPIILKSNITLDIAAGTVLEASGDHEDFPALEVFRAPGRQSLLSAKDAENLTITGGGTIDGKGDTWWPHPSQPRPRLIVFDHCKHVRMENITVQNSPMWQIVPYYSSDLEFRNMKILATVPSPNTDGINPFSSTHIVIDHVLIDTGDDNIAIKSGQPNSPGPDDPTSDVTVTNCTFLHGHGLSIGSEVAGGVHNIHADHITFKGTDNGIRIKSNRDRGNDISDITYRDITMEDVKIPLLISEFYPKIPDEISASPVTGLTPHFHDITIENVHASGGHDAAVIVGLPESPVKGLKISNVKISAEYGAKIQYAEVNSQGFIVSPREGLPFITGTGVSGKLGH